MDSERQPGIGPQESAPPPDASRTGTDPRTAGRDPATFARDPAALGRDPTPLSRDPQGSAAGPGREPTPPPEPARPAAPAEPLSRTEQTLVQIRDLLEIQARERQYQTASPLLIVGLVVQVAVVGLIALALLDWAFANFAAPLYIKLLLAVVLQLIALTVFVVTRER